MTSQKRKLMYAGGIVILLIPIIYLGRPLSSDVDNRNGNKQVAGGELAKMRVKYDLGEATLGDVDPTSSAMNLVLLGLRGPAASVLHLRAMDYQAKKDWARLKSTVDSIIKLQPHYEEIWRFQGWNLAFNVSREWDKVDDRFYWVKDGIKFLQTGTQRNQTATILFYNVGDFIGRKIGSSDEKKYFRKFFKYDPDVERFGVRENGLPKPDSEINPDGLDNYQVAHQWFVTTNELDERHRIRGMTHVFARQGPARALLNYAKALNDDGVYGEEAKAAWDSAYEEWTNVFGREVFLGRSDIRYRLNSTEDDILSMAAENDVTRTEQARVLDQNIQMTKFTWWRDYANCERDPLTLEARETFYKAKDAFNEARTDGRLDPETGEYIPSEAEKLFTRSLELFEQVGQKFDFMRNHDEFIEECMLNIYYLRQIAKLNTRELPADYPLKGLVEANPTLYTNILIRYQQETRGY